MNGIAKAIAARAAAVIARLAKGRDRQSLPEQLDETTYGVPMGCPTVLDHFTRMQDVEREYRETAKN